MKIVIPGGTGHLGRLLVKNFLESGHEVVVLTRGQKSAARTVHWDGQSTGPWMSEIDGADVVINLAGRSVDCRYAASNLKAMMDSRVRSTNIIGAAVAASKRPPSVWLQMSTATIYAHTVGPAHDEATGVIGGTEPGVPDYWGTSIKIATAWERALQRADTPNTRKVALRTAMVMSRLPGGTFRKMAGLARWGLGGPVAGGQQYMSWIHEADFVRAIRLIIDHDSLDGPVNLASPHPIPYADFMSSLRDALGIRFGLPATRWMAEVGAFFMRTDTELILKSRRVVPGRLLEAGFCFDYPRWEGAVRDLVRRDRSMAVPDLAVSGALSLDRRVA